MASGWVGRRVRGGRDTESIARGVGRRASGTGCVCGCVSSPNSTRAGLDTDRLGILWTSCPSVLLLPPPGEAEAAYAELHDPPMLDLGEVSDPPVRFAEADVARLLPEHVDLPQHLPAGRRLHRSPLAVPGDVEVNRFL